VNDENRAGDVKTAAGRSGSKRDVNAARVADLPPPPPPPRPPAAFAARLGADYLLERVPFFVGRKAARQSREQRTTKLLQELKTTETDPMLFDLMLSNEIDRRLKTRFGVVFVLLTFLFTSSSYAIIVLNGIFQWNISSTAITGLIIETPIQFIGILYIIARNLFPDGSRVRGFAKSPGKKHRRPGEGSATRREAVDSAAAD
jgi:hypothetical protein